MKFIERNDPSIKKCWTSYTRLILHFVQLILRFIVHRFSSVIFFFFCNEARGCIFLHYNPLLMLSTYIRLNLLLVFWTKNSFILNFQKTIHFGTMNWLFFVPRKFSWIEMLKNFNHLTHRKSIETEQKKPYQLQSFSF